MNFKFIFFIILFLLLILILIIEKVVLKQKLKNNSEYGSSRFSTVKEIKKNFIKEKITDIDKVGFPIWFDRFLKHVWFDYETPHWTFIGSSGSGKSSTSVIPQCTFIANSKENKSLFITDPKGEIFNKTSKMFKLKGYQILTLDLRKPYLSNRINILEPCLLEYDKYLNCLDKYNNIINLNSNFNNDKLHLLNEANEHLAECNRLVNSISSMITSDKVTSDPFWNNSAKDLLEGLINFFLEEYKEKNIKREDITLSKIKKFQNSTMIEENLKIFLDYLSNKEYGTKSKDKLMSLITSSESTYKSIVSVFNEKMSIFDDINVENITSESDFSLDILGKQKSVLYFIIPDEDKTYFKLISLIISLIYKELVKCANNTKEKKLNIPVSFILDEFANMPPIHDIDNIISVSRSRNMFFNFYIQSFSQLENVYGKNVAQIILDNTGLAYLKTNTEECANQISKMLGNKTIESHSLSYSLNSNFNGNTSSSLIGRPLLTSDEIKQLHYKMIIFPIKGHPIIRKTIYYTNFKNYIDGEIERQEKYIKQISNYFTVENINIVKTSNNFDNVDENNIKQKQELEELIKFLSKNLINIKYFIDYKIKNKKTMAILNFYNPLSGLKLMNLLGDIDLEKFEYEVFSSDSIKEKYGTIIEIKLKEK